MKKIFLSILLLFTMWSSSGAIYKAQVECHFWDC